MRDSTLEGRRLLVVGASSGIGLAIGRAAAARGARVAFAARRRERLEQAAKASRGVAVEGDVRSEAECERLVSVARSALGGLDVLVYAAGVAPLARLLESDAALWRDTFATNVFGAAAVTRAALPHLAGGLAAYLSSDVVGRPREGCGTYAATKAALDEMLRIWRLEHPELRFLRIALGATLGTEAGRDYDPQRTRALFEAWRARGAAPEGFLQAQDLGELIAEVLATCLAHPGAAVEELLVRPPT